MSKTRQYELIILIQPQLEESARNQLITDVEKMIRLDETEENNLTITKWGMRSLAYEINKLKEAFYVLFEGPMDGQILREHERSFTYNEDIIRYQFVRKDA